MKAMQLFLLNSVLLTTRFTVDGVEEIKEFPAGIAHFLEHKLFEDQDGQDYLQHFVKLGAESNAFTSFTNQLSFFDYFECQ